MTVDEKKDRLRKYCWKTGCRCCKLYKHYGTFPAVCYSDATPKQIDTHYNIVFGEEEPTTPDNINHPTHYCREGAIESIDEMELIFGKQAVKHFCLCNAWKYRYRASAKNGDEDLRKSDWYIKKYRELCESDESDESDE